MLKFVTGASLFLLSLTSIAATAIAFKDNNDLSITLSKDNYNRLVVKNDKILEYFFPDKSIEHRIDEDREGVYIMPVTTPVTVFVTTEKGHHFSINITAEEGLGKTFEFIAQTQIAQKQSVKTALPTPESNTYQEAIVSFIQNMEKKEKPDGVSINRPFNKMQRLGRLSIFKKEIWNSVAFKGEISEIYNGSKETLTMDASWFNTPDTLGVKFSKNTLAPNEKILLYRVTGANHG